ncbi:THUMP domain-containing class I SAM-dependent RNA methyltransferase [Celeribacter litoreus]|uniref:THUMP domain-containing class I SAM-dependent RNA methyltransferase n=1 Tax=Celeribacter litoreus TaxID=2876714 RepID=UPI001CCCA664|nr:class I SAM-dependent RNA methyltransferase [Celeribacter litoreus]MCA0045020.1 class I SAM-dependent RNA methyltransferase [Celeribacter litoreus]
MSSATFEIFLGTQPGLEDVLLAEAIEAGFPAPVAVGGGVTFEGTWTDVMRANVVLRGAARVLARIGTFRAFHLAQLDKRSRKFPWGDTLRADVPVRVEVVTGKRNKIYHAGAAQERIERAITEELGCPIAEDAPIVIKVRIEDDNVILSVDTSGEALHKRGFKQGVGKAPMRETMAASLLRACGYAGTEPVLDPMCGSGTFPIEAAELAKGFYPGRGRSFAFEHLAGFDAAALDALRKECRPIETDLRFYGSDRNVNVIGMATDNAARAGVGDICEFKPVPVSAIERPEGPAGLVIVNPPYGSRVGKKKDLFALYGAFGDVMREKFSGWRVGMVTSDTTLAQATKLPWKPTGAPIAHGGLKVRLFQTDPLG